MENKKKESKRELLTLIVLFILLEILILQFQAFVYWGIGYFICWVFGIGITWTYWHGLAITFIITILKDIFSKIASKE